MNNDTKIIATIGPASDDPITINKMLESGVNVFRLNFKHGNKQEHQERITKIKNACKEVNKEVEILIDLQGPEIRAFISGNSLPINTGDKILLGEEPTEKGITISHPYIIKHIKNNEKVIIDDGRFVFNTLIEGDKCYLIAVHSGELKNRKTMNIPEGDFPLDVLTERDYEGIDLAVENNLDYIALSFVRNKEDIEKLKEILANKGANSKIVSKIEARKAIDNIEEIVKISDVIMVARGDLGVELPIEQVPFWQKKIIASCKSNNTPVIVATQMLESMIENPFPTRAEISDIANAVWDGANFVMLSGEVANGKYPVECIQMMKKTVDFANKNKVEIK